MQDPSSARKRENKIRSRNKRTFIEDLVRTSRASNGGKVASSILVVSVKHQKRVGNIPTLLFVLPGHFLLLPLHRVKCPIACDVVVIPTEPVLNLDRGAGIRNSDKPCGLSGMTTGGYSAACSREVKVKLSLLYHCLTIL